MVTANYPAPPIVWSRARAGAAWHARRSGTDAAALCRFVARTGWVGVREAPPRRGDACTVCWLRAPVVLAAAASGRGDRP